MSALRFTLFSPITSDHRGFGQSKPGMILRLGQRFLDHRHGVPPPPGSDVRSCVSREQIKENGVGDGGRSCRETATSGRGPGGRRSGAAGPERAGWTAYSRPLLTVGAASERRSQQKARVCGAGGGIRTRRRQRSWFKAHPKEEPMNHPLAVVSHGARRAPVTRMGIHPEDFKSFKSPIYDIWPQQLTTIDNTANRYAHETCHWMNHWGVWTPVVDGCGRVSHECPTGFRYVYVARWTGSARSAGSGPLERVVRRCISYCRFHSMIIADSPSRGRLNISDIGQQKPRIHTGMTRCSRRLVFPSGTRSKTPGPDR